MKYVLAGLAIVAAVAALLFRPPHDPEAPKVSPGQGAGAPAFPLRDAGPRTPAFVPAQTRGARIPGSRPAIVYVAGEVMKPGVYTLAADRRAQDALARAGGPKPDADLVAVNLAAPLKDGEEIVVPKIGAEAPRSRRVASPRVRASHAPRGHGRPARPAPEAAPPQSVDLNMADESELETLPGIGPALAARIVAYREENGPFTSIDELADVAGITPHLQDVLADFLVIR